MKPNADNSECELMFHYLKPGFELDAFSEKYKQGVQILNLNLPEEENEILLWTQKNPWSVQWVDCGLALFKKQSQLRRRFLLANALTECTPHSFDRFLNDNRVSFPLIKIILVGIRSVCAMLMAFFLFTLKGWK